MALIVGNKYDINGKKTMDSIYHTYTMIPKARELDFRLRECQWFGLKTKTERQKRRPRTPALTPTIFNFELLKLMNTTKIP